MKKECSQEERAAAVLEAVSEQCEEERPQQEIIDMTGKDALTASDESMRLLKRKQSDAVRRVQCAITEIMATAGSEIEVFDMLRRELADLMEVNNFVIVDYDEKTNTLCARSGMIRDEGEPVGSWSAEKSLTRFVIESKRAMRFSKSEIRRLADEGKIRFVGKIRAESWVGIPLQNTRSVFGAMLIQSYTNPHAYDDECMEILQSVGNQLSVYLEKKRAENAFQESEELFRTFFEQHSVGFAIIKPGGEWLRFNDRFCEIAGYAPEELELLTWRDITAPEYVERERYPYIEDLITGRTDFYTLDKQYVRRDGSRVDVSISTRLLRKGDGTPKYFISTVQDISARKRNERDLLRHQDAIIASMAILAERRDHGTGEHIRRTKGYVRLLLELAEGERYYPAEHIDLLSQAAILHDIGKVGVSDGILLKPGKLTPGEFEIVKRHTLIGGEVLAAAAKILGDAPFISYARQIIEFHHEKWDGSGYPHGLKGEAIPFIARIMAIADVYDALVSERPYKEPMSHEEAVSIIADGAGKHFDPCLVEVFLRSHAEFEKISRADCGII